MEITPASGAGSPSSILGRGTMVVLQRYEGAQRFSDASTPPKGTWIRWVYTKGNHTAALCCPTCGHAFCLVGHRVNDQGDVSPSVVCPHGCGFHVMMRLDGWP